MFSFLNSSHLFNGFTLFISLIAIIGPQNIFIINQALKRERLAIVCLVSIFVDIVFISTGVTLIGYLSYSFQHMMLWMYYVGLFFLSWVLFNLLFRLFSNNKEFIKSLNYDVGEPIKIRKAVSLALFYAIMNPLTWIETIGLISLRAATLSEGNQILFSIGAILGSFVWFLGLGYSMKFFGVFCLKRVNYMQTFLKLINLVGVIVISRVIYDVFNHFLNEINKNLPGYEVMLLGLYFMVTFFFFVSEVMEFLHYRRVRHFETVLESDPDEIDVVKLSKMVNLQKRYVPNKKETTHFNDIFTHYNKKEKLNFWLFLAVKNGAKPKIIQDIAEFSSLNDSDKNILYHWLSSKGSDEHHKVIEALNLSAITS